MQYRAKETFQIKMNNDYFIVLEDTLWEPLRELADIIWIKNGKDEIGLSRRYFVKKFERSKTDERN